MSDEKKWYVAYTIPRWEKKVARILTESGIENYCPLNRVTKNWSDRKKMIQEPLFKGYVFVRIASSELNAVKEIKGIINYIFWLGKPAIVKNEDIETIRRFLNEFTEVSVEEYKLDVNTKVVVSGGVLMDYKGTIVDVLGNKARVLIESMGIQLSALVEKKNLQPLN